MSKLKSTIEKNSITIKLDKELVEKVLQISKKKNVSKVIENLLKEEIDIQKKYEELKAGR